MHRCSDIEHIQKCELNVALRLLFLTTSFRTSPQTATAIMSHARNGALAFEKIIGQHIFHPEYTMKTWSLCSKASRYQDSKHLFRAAELCPLTLALRAHIVVSQNSSPWLLA
jgi:hypothetical protein